MQGVFQRLRAPYNMHPIKDSIDRAVVAVQVSERQKKKKPTNFNRRHILKKKCVDTEDLPQ